MKTIKFENFEQFDVNGHRIDDLEMDNEENAERINELEK